MSNRLYRNQVKLLLSVLPIIAEYKYLALYGGTAINLFIRNLPRLSVDIDLTYTEIQEWEPSLAKINELLGKFRARILDIIPNTSARHDQKSCKLFVSNTHAQIKIEVNKVKRGLLGNARLLGLCEKAQDDFDTYCEIPVMPLGQLYGSKLCAALDRQHPRDLFDTKYILEDEGFSDEIKPDFC